MKSFIKPGEPGSLIPKDAADELARQDAERDKIRSLPQSVRTEMFRSSFLANHLDEMNFAMKWGAEADTVNTGWGEEVRPGGRIRDKYPPRNYGRIETFVRRWKTKRGVPVFQWEPRLNGLILNEGGRGFTLMVTRMVPFRLYIAGLTINRSQKGEWTFARPRAWEDHLLKKLGWMRRNEK